MFKKLLILIGLLLCLKDGIAQTDSSSTPAGHLRISLLTCGTGDEIWQTFGHTAIRVTDSVWGTDMVFNYGTFSFGDDFAMQFMRGKLLYYLSFYPYPSFLQEYADENRSVEEQELIMDDNTKEQVYAFLRENAKEENRYYKYDFFFDNCATRIRDVFPSALGEGFVYGKTVAADNKITFRNIINRYYYKDHWLRFGINILLGSRIDPVMTNKDIMFLPDYLRDGVAGATVNGKKIAQPTKLIIGGSPKVEVGINWPMVVMSLVALLTIIGLTLPNLRPLGNVMSFLLLLVTGLLGCLILVMWFGTDHQGCQNNTNLLWALPTNLFIAFAPRKNKGRYGLVGIFLILVAILLHILKVQELPLTELSPLLLALTFVYGMIYKRDR
jgi:hypothetical protein